MLKVFQTFIDGLADGADADALHEALAVVADRFDLPLFAYFCIPKASPETPWLVTNYAVEWTDRYVASGFERVDPVIRSAKAMTRPFTWSDASGGPDAEQERWFLEEAAGFGIAQGFTIPIPEPSAQVAALSFASDASTMSFQRTLDKHSAVLQLIAAYFHRQARRRLSSDLIVDGIQLTGRELQCLRWAAEGKSAGDTGQILNISRHTVSFHLDHVREKLGVRSMSQAIALYARTQR